MKDPKRLHIYMTVNFKISYSESIPGRFTTYVARLRADRTLIFWGTEFLRNGKPDFRKRSLMGKIKCSLRRAQHLPRLSFAPLTRSADLLVTRPPDRKTCAYRFNGKSIQQELS